MTSKLDELLMQLSISDLMYSEYDEEIFHYTSPGGFESILFSDKDNITLWASRYDCLNDASEGTIAQKIYEEVCEELRSNNQITEIMYNVIATVVPARTVLFMHDEGDKVKMTREEYDRFVCSFSKNKDALAMWNYYSKGSKYEGYNVGISALEVKDSLAKSFDNKKVSVHICPVIYEKEEQKRIIRKLLLKLQGLYKKEHENSIRYVVSNKLLEWSLTFKSEYFQHEEEVRIIVDVAKKTENGIIQKRPLDLKYRNAHGYMIPYIELRFKKEALISISAGPLQCDDNQKEVQKDIMKTLLHENGYCAMAECSKIPVRY